MSNKKNKIIELSQKYAIVYLPENAVEAEITAKVYEDDEITKVSKKMSLSEIKQAFDEYKIAEEEFGYFPPDAEFVITDEGRAFIDF